jgi:hypothetical protein
VTTTTNPDAASITGQLQAILTDPSGSDQRNLDGLGCLVRDAARAGHLEARLQLLWNRNGCATTVDGQIGDPAIAADALAHNAVALHLIRNTTRRDVFVVGEDVKMNIPIMEGCLVFAVDGIDGTLPARALKFGYSTVVVAFEQTKGRHRPIAAAITCGTSTVSLDADGAVYVCEGDGPAADDLRISSAPRSTLPVVAAVAAKASDRAKLELLLQASGSDAIFTLGGTPTIGGLIAGELGASVAMSPQTVWDAAHLLIAAHAGLTAVTIADPTRILTVAEVDALFTTDSLGDNSAQGQQVPPFVVGADSARVMQIASALHGMP